MLDLIWLLIGLMLLIGGAELLVQSAVALATRFRVPPLIIGLTVVAFGTSTPELLVNLDAAFRGAPDVGFGNIIGSNIANIGLVLGAAAVIAPLAVHASVVAREIPMMVLVSVAVLVMAADALLGGGSVNRLDRGDGLVLLLLFAVFLYYLVADVVKAQVNNSAPGVAPTGGWISVGLIVVSLVALLFGAEMSVSGAVGLAQAAGVPQVVIGLTLVAVGTSLPELATSLVAARRGQTDLAVGNVVGSNIFNLAFVMGLTVSIRPSAVPAGGLVDIVVMVGFSILLLPMAMTKRSISRREGVVLLLGYAVFIVWLAFR